MSPSPFLSLLLKRQHKAHPTAAVPLCSLLQWSKDSATKLFGWDCLYPHVHAESLRAEGGWRIVSLKEGPLGSCKQGPRREPHSPGPGWGICPFPVPERRSSNRPKAVSVQRAQPCVLDRHDKDLTLHAKEAAVHVACIWFLQTYHYLVVVFKHSFVLLHYLL